MTYCGRVVSCAIGLTLILNSSELTAQTTGRIEGRVVDQAGDVLPGANVRVEGPSLQGARSVVSDHQGRFRFPVVPPGTHTVRVELTGFAARVLADVRVGLDRTATLEIEMQPALTEAMLVEGESPIIDLAGTTTGADYDDKLMRSLPLGRDFMGLAFTAPGVAPSGLGNNPSVRGASAAENRYVVDGIDVTDPGYGTWETSIAPELLEQVEVKTGGYQAEYGGALGGVLNVVTKSGSNLSHGDVFAYFNNDALSARSPATEGFGRTLGRSTYDLGFDVGGKLVHDRLWYFAALNPWFSQTDALTRQDLAYTTKAKTLSYSGKLTWRPDDKNQLVLSAFGDPSRTDDSELRSAAGHVVSDSESGASTYSARFSSTPDPRLLLELNAGYYHQTDQVIPERGELPSYYDLSAGGSWAREQGCGDPDLVSERGVTFVPGCRGSSYSWDGDRSRGQVRGSASWFVTSHALKLGLDWSHTSFGVRTHSTAPHGGSLADAEGTVFAPDGVPGGSFTLHDGYYELDAFEQDAVGEADELALYVQDQWRITPRFTLNAGVRFDSLSSTGSATAEFPNRRLEFGVGDMIGPRLGIVWDVTGKGQSRLFASAARFFESVPLDLAVRSFGREHYDAYYFLYPEDGALPTYDNPGLFLDSFGFGTGVDTDPGLKAQYTDELVVGVEHELVRGLAVGLKGVYRELGNVVEDISLDDGETYFITNPGGTFDRNPVTNELLDEPVAFPRAVRKYKAVELTVDRRSGATWQLHGSYVLAKNEGNYGGLYRQDNGQLDPNITSLFDLPSLLEGAYGPLPNDRRHQAKLYGSYAWPFRLVTGGFLRYLSGTPISRLGAHTLYGQNERFVTPRGSAGLTPALWQLDLHVEYPLRLNQNLRLSLMADVFNVANRKQATTVNQTWTYAALDSTEDPNECGGPGTGPGTSCPQGNPDFGTPVAYQTPRSIRLGMRLTW